MKAGVVVLGLMLVVSAVGVAFADPGGSSDEPSVNPEAQAQFDQGMGFVRRKQWPQAIQAFMLAVRFEPNYVEAWNNLGYSYRKINDNQKALEAYQRALRIRPDYAPAHEYIGRLYLALGNKEQAMRHYETLRGLDPRLAAELLRAIEANNSDYGED